MHPNKLTSGWKVLLACLALVPSFGFTRVTGDDTEIANPTKAEVLAKVTQILEQDAFVPGVDFGNWKGYIAKEQTDIAKAKTEGDFTEAVQKALLSFGLSHNYLLSPATVSARQDHSVVGIGVSYFPDKAGLLITKVYPGGAASKAGLVAGDIIVAVENKRPSVATAIRGPAGTRVTVTVKHEDGKSQNVTMVREAFNTNEPASLIFQNESTSVVRIPSFDLSYDPGQVEDLFASIKSSQNLVLDLRGNPGGAVVNLLHLLGLMLPPDTNLGTMIGPNDVRAYQKLHDGKIDLVKVANLVPVERKLKTFRQSKVPYFKGKIAVLINAGSGSASEMAAAALRDDANATVLGHKSAGAVLVSIIKDLPDGFKLQIPIRDYVTIGGVRLEGAGVKPDVVTNDPKIPGRDKDETVQRAVAILQKLSKTEPANSVKTLNLAGWLGYWQFGRA